MRVLHILDSLNRGGAETQALDVCRNAARFGIELSVFACGGDGLEDEFRSTDVRFFRVNRKLPIDLNVVRKLRSFIKVNKVEVVHGYQAVDGLHAYLATRGLGGVKTVLSFQGGYVPDIKNKWTLNFLIPRMDANIAVSKGLLEELSEVSGLKTAGEFTVIYNGADPGRLEPTGHLVRKELCIPKSSLVVGMIANFYRDPRKDQLTVVKALPRIFAEFPDAHCLFAGMVESGAEPKFEECKRFCIESGFDDRVHFLGGRNDVPDVLASMDVFIFSSLQEGLPVALTEAMLAKVPAIVSDIGPHLEATDNGKFAVVFRTQDAEDLAEKTLSLMKDEKGRTELAEKVHKYALANFSIDAHIFRLKELYERLIRV